MYSTASGPQLHQLFQAPPPPPTVPVAPVRASSTTSSQQIPAQHQQHYHQQAQHQQLHQTLQQQLQRHHQLTLINQQQQQSTTNVDATNNALSSHQTNTNSSAATTTTTNNMNQVPILANFNSCNAAQPFLNLPAPAPLAAHLNLSNNHLQQTGITALINNNINNGSNSTASHLASTNASTTTNSTNQISHRPLATNTTLNSVANQQQNTNSRIAPQPPINQPAQASPHPAQQLAQASRNLLSDEALSSLFNEHFQAILINQLFANHQFAPPPVAPQQAPVPPMNPTRPTQTSLPPSGPVVAPSQPIPPTQQAPSGVVTQSQQPPTVQLNQEPQITDQQNQVPLQQQAPTFQPVSQTTAQTRMAQVPPPMLDTYQNPPNNLYQQNQQNTGPVNWHHVNQPQDPVPPQTQQQQQQQQPQQQQQQQPQQPQQPQHSRPTWQQQTQPPLATVPPIPFYGFPQMEQALAILTNPQVASNLFNQVFNMYLQSGLRSEPHHTHHHHHPPHYYHHHLHGSHHHHHHHHGPNGQSNGQDDTMLTISESKPRGLNRAEIDSLTPYIQMNEKDSRTCVICLSRFELKSKIRPLPCNHAFHAKCVDKWLRANRTCPICRRDALKTYGAKIKRI